MKTVATTVPRSNRHRVDPGTIAKWAEQYDLDTVQRMAALAEDSAIGHYTYDDSGNVLAVDFPADADGPAWSWRRDATP